MIMFGLVTLAFLLFADGQEFVKGALWAGALFVAWLYEQEKPRWRDVSYEEFNRLEAEQRTRP